MGKTFTKEEIIKWAEKQKEYADSPFTNSDPHEAYKQALNHLIHYLNNPIKEII